MSKIFEQIAEEINTKEELVVFIEEINALHGFIFKDSHIPLSDRAKNKVDEGFRTYLKELEKGGFLHGSPEEQLSFFENLKSYLSRIPQLKLEIAFSPSDDFFIELRRWFFEKNKHKVIFDITVNPQIIGGAIIEYGGNYRDFSLLEKMNKELSKIKL